MKNKITLAFIALVLLSTLNPQLSTAHAQGTAFTYQGRLNNNGNAATGIYDLRFTVYDAVTNGNLAAGPLTNAATGVSNGLFTATLDFGAGVFTGPARWLELDVRTNGGGAFTPLVPLQAITATPYAIMASSASNLLGSVAAAQLNGTLQNSALPVSPVFSGTVSANGGFYGDGGGLTGLSPGSLSAGTAAINISGNAATATTANALNPTNDVQGPRLNVGFNHDLTGNSATIAGGAYNTNTGTYATVGGGDGNLASGHAATVAGGSSNIATNTGTAIGGGNHNWAGGYFSTISGGENNIASNNYATVSGGSFNVAGGRFSLAAGQQAQALHAGSFVWADSQNAAFASTAADQFNIRAQGGVRMVTGGAGLMVDGNPVQTSANNGFVVQQNTNDAPDIIGGSSANGVAPGVVGATISGGGATNYIWAWGILDWIPIYSGVFVNTVGYFPGVSNNIASDFGVTQLKLDRCLCSFCL